MWDTARKTLFMFYWVDWRVSIRNLMLHNQNSKIFLTFLWFFFVILMCLLNIRREPIRPKYIQANLSWDISWICFLFEFCVSLICKVYYEACENQSRVGKAEQKELGVWGRPSAAPRTKALSCKSSFVDTPVFFADMVSHSTYCSTAKI